MSVGSKTPVLANCVVEVEAIRVMIHLHTMCVAISVHGDSGGDETREV